MLYAAKSLFRQPVAHGRNHKLAELMKRDWAIDVLQCPRCGGRMRMLAAIHSPETALRILDWLGLPSRAPSVAPPSVSSPLLEKEGMGFQHFLLWTRRGPGNVAHL